jgi:fluoroquinolone transport system ATP-binding protein
LTYPGAQRRAVRDVVFSVEPDEIFGFLGPSGAGTSTTQNVLIRLLGGYEGNVAVMGKDLRAWDRGYYRRVGVAFEAPNHYLKLTARENLQLFAGSDGGETEDPSALLERVGLDQDADTLVGCRYSMGCPPDCTRQNRASRSNSSQGGEPTGSPLATRVMRINGRHP